MGLRISGTIAALTSLLCLGRAYILASNSDLAGFVLVAIFGLYFAYVGYLTWFRFSPWAIRHICGATLCLVFFVVRLLIHLVSQGHEVKGLLSILLIVGLVWVYRKAWRYLSALIFGGHETKSAS